MIADPCVLFPFRAEPSVIGHRKSPIHEQATHGDCPFAIAILQHINIASATCAHGLAIWHAHEEKYVAFGMRNIAADFAVVTGDAVVGGEKRAFDFDGEGDKRVDTAHKGTVVVDGVRVIRISDKGGVQPVKAAPVGIDAIEDIPSIAEGSNLAAKFVQLLVHIGHVVTSLGYGNGHHFDRSRKQLRGDELSTNC